MRFTYKGTKIFYIATDVSYSVDNVLKYKSVIDLDTDHYVEEFITCYEVERLLRLQKNTSAGCDLLPRWLLRACSFELASPIAHIYNCTIHSGIVPISWHTAIVTPVPKVAAPASLNDYRPISVTPILSRIAEMYIVKHFIRPAIPRDAILDQFAFKPSGSTTCALVSLQHHVAYLLETNSYVRCLIIDFSKAFDTIDHSVLLSKFSS